ncbi:hypothetical protein CSKR_200249, partial [Clonorchis sinensis]
MSLLSAQPALLRRAIPTGMRKETGPDGNESSHGDIDQAIDLTGPVCPVTVER